MAEEVGAARRGVSNTVAQTLMAEQKRRDDVSQANISNFINMGNMFSQFTSNKLAVAAAAGSITAAQQEAGQDWIDNLLKYPVDLDDPTVMEQITTKAASFGLNPETFVGQIREVLRARAAAENKGSGGGGDGSGMNAQQTAALQEAINTPGTTRQDVMNIGQRMGISGDALRKYLGLGTLEGDQAITPGEGFFHSIFGDNVFGPG